MLTRKVPLRPSDLGIVISEGGLQMLGEEEGQNRQYHESVDVRPSWDPVTRQQRVDTRRRGTPEVVSMSKTPAQKLSCQRLERCVEGTRRTYVQQCRMRYRLAERTGVEGARRRR